MQSQQWTTRALRSTRTQCICSCDNLVRNAAPIRAICLGDASPMILTMVKVQPFPSMNSSGCLSHGALGSGQSDSSSALTDSDFLYRAHAVAELDLNHKQCFLHPHFCTWEVR